MMKYTLPRALTFNLIDPTYPASALDGLNAALQAGINAEPDWGVGQAAGPLIRWFEYSHGNVGAGKAWALSQLPLVPGRPSPFFEALDNATQDGAVLNRGSGAMATLEGNMDPEWQEPSRMALVVIAGGEVEGVQVFFQITDPTAEVPETLPNRTYATGAPGSETTHVHTWNTYGVDGDSHKPVQVGSYWYKPSTMGASGVPLKASDWFGYHMTGGAIVSVTAYQAIVAANATPMP